MNGRVLVVDDDPDMCDLLREALVRRDLDVVPARSAEVAFSALDEQEFDVVITDLNMRGMNGIDLCERITLNRPDVPVIVITAFGNLDCAIAAIRAGAHDFLVKPFEVETLAMATDRALKYRSLKEEVKRLRLEVSGIRTFQEILGDSLSMQRLVGTLPAIAASDASVLITGETGTGKELVARAVHQASRRAEGPFVVVNCAAVPEALLESELFGHVKGAFTDARSDRAGLLARAAGGTLFLDEIGDMAPAVQPKLLRALQERKVKPVGSDSEIAVDVRLVTATHQDLEALAREGRFREDLLFRINVIHVEVPPLRARGNDVLLLAQRFLRDFAMRSGRGAVGLSRGAAEKLVAYSWPGNVRELQNCIERAVALTRYEDITVEDLPEKIRSYSRSRVPEVGDDLGELVPLEEVERRYIFRVLDSVGGNKTTAAQILGLDRKTLYRKLERYGTPEGSPPAAGPA